MREQLLVERDRVGFLADRRRAAISPGRRKSQLWTGLHFLVRARASASRPASEHMKKGGSYKELPPAE